MGKRELSKAEFAERYDFVAEFLSVVAANDDSYPTVQRAARALLVAMEQEGLVTRHPPVDQGN
ncbi:MAG TPA: hypothetical protein VGR87_00575 [Candidatus Limnocylindria bacterium]|nr:hypothetical protein [Candidatus Limnocylindria bacterium]